MKNRYLKFVVATILILVASCDEPETVVTDIVHTDGSVTRKIEMRNIEDKFNTSDIQVPFDSTWLVKDSLEIDDKGDTIFVRRAEKTFLNVDELNLTYKNDSGANKNITREALFSKKFRWFNTEYRFTENIDKKLGNGYPLSDFLSSEELHFFYSPENLKEENLNGPDSLRYKALQDSIKLKTDDWSMKNLISEWITEFVKLTKGKAGPDLSMESLKSHENDFVKICRDNEDKLDSLWSNGIILKQFIGEDNALKYKTEADSAVNIAAENFWVDFKEYSVRISMPGKLTATNGFIDSSKILLWPVKSDYFLSEPYEMWAESKLPNRWAWTVSGLFLVFVLTGVLIKIIKKG
jgi:hypothetical protein